MRLLTLFFFAFISTVNAQTVIDYQTFSSAACNIFASATNVAATINGSSGTITHLTTLGQPQYSTPSSAVSLDGNSSSGQRNGADYRIAYNFQQYHTYAVKVNAAEISNSGPLPGLRLSLVNTTGGNTVCTGAQTTSPFISGPLVQGSSIAGVTFVDYTITFTLIASANAYMTVGIVPGLNAGFPNNTYS
jgi:hypothetical protein